MTLSKYTPAVAAMALIAVAATAGDFTRYVNPFIGTGNIEGGLSGNCYPGATVPFGMVQVCADTHPAPDWYNASGYNYNDSTIYGKSPLSLPHQALMAGGELHFEMGR